MDDETCIWLVIGAMLVAGWLVDRAVPQRDVDWSDQLASQDDVAKIVAGKQRQGPRHLLKLTLLLIVVFVLWRLIA